MTTTGLLPDLNGTSAFAFALGDVANVANYAASGATVNATVNAADTTVTVSSAVAFQIGTLLLIDNEIMQVTGIVGAVLTVSRGLYNTAQLIHAIGATISTSTVVTLFNSSGALQFRDASGTYAIDIAPLITGGAIDGTPIGATTPSTGVFSSLAVEIGGFTGQFSHANSANRVYTFPDATDTVVLLAQAQTLTNKTLTSPTLTGGTINNAVIGGSTPAPITATTLTNQGLAVIGQINSQTIPASNGAGGLATIWNRSNGGGEQAIFNLAVSGAVQGFELNQITGSGTFLNVWKVDGTGNMTATATIKGTHLIGKTTAPGIAAGTGAGTSPTVSLTNATDMAGLVTITTGTGAMPGLAAVATITFNTPYGQAPNVLLYPANAAAAAIVATSAVYVTSTTNAFVINSGNGGLTNSTAYKWFYVCVQ